LTEADVVDHEKRGTAPTLHPPTPAQLGWVVSRVAARVARWVPDLELEEEAEFVPPALPIQGVEPFEPTPSRLHAAEAGFDLHAGVFLAAWQRDALERLCRYMLRGPVVPSRLKRARHGRLFYGFKQPRPNGTVGIELTPMALLARLAALVPRPRVHLVRYGGVLAPASPLRRGIVPSPAGKPKTRRCGRGRLKWAELLRRVFALDVLACACGATRRVMGSTSSPQVATIERGPVSRKILAQLDLDPEPPPITPAREPDQRSFWPTRPPRGSMPDLVDPPHVVEWNQSAPADLCCLP
jgi:hypothetical protein